MPPIPPADIARARDLYDAQSWTDAHAAFDLADRAAPLGAEDLVRASVSAYLTGREEQSIDLLMRAFRGCLDSGEAAMAARTAFWLAFTYDARGDRARAEAWVRRLGGVVAEAGLDAERALVSAGLAHAALWDHGADLHRALGLARDAIAIARPVRDTDTEVLSRLSAGWALLRLGRPVEGIGELDEAMARVTCGDVPTPIVSGVAYCSVISASLHTADLPRAREWTTAASAWCARQSGLVPFRGQCLVHRSVVKTLDGDWPGALDEALSAQRRLLPADTGAAAYQIGELHRLEGRFTEAEDAYRAANSAGRRPEPGLMLLRLAQGRTDAAVVSAKRLSRELARPAERAEFLPAYVEVMAAAGDPEACSAGAAELESIAEATDAELPRAHALAARGTALLADGDPSGAAARFRTASMAWHDLRLPYLEAKSRAGLARCYAALGDDEAAALEAEAARDAFARLGAAPDLAALPALAAGAGHASSSAPLTEREVGVMRLVARGLTNRGVAEELVLSEKTVARHLANIYAKLGIGSRAAATAYAYDHGLV